MSLFSGAGGFDEGFHQADFQTVWANDINEDACETFGARFGKGLINRGSITKYIPEFNQSWDIDVLIGGPPCQGFSVAGYMNLDDPRSELVFRYMDVLRAVRPSAFILENVKALAVLAKFKPIRDRLRREANDAGYDAEIFIVKSSDFGVSQARERMILVGFKNHRVSDFKAALEMQKERAKPLRETIQKFGRAGSPTNPRICKAKVTIAKCPVLRSSPYAGMLFNGQGRPLDLNGYASTLPASMGGNRTPIIDEEQLYGGLSPWVEDYHKQLIETGKVWPENEAPNRLRRLTLDEAAAIQTFPEDFEFSGRKSSIYAQIGNAVPCELARRIAEATKSVLNGYISNVRSTSEVEYA
ncbi:DNA cytosine methyltransferase [Parerythrobacter aurantius]|uniref:DNA cytosine methyltransferase n=1 Tax=Parerythrobacter aurantius TaxID=3127706 RepID=UPI0032453376